MNLANTSLHSLGKKNNLTVMPLGFTESPYFLQILKADLDDITFPRGSTLLQYIGDLLLCSSQTFPQDDHSLKGHKVL